MEWNEETRFGGTLSQARIPLWRTWLGDEAIAYIYVDRATDVSIDRLRAASPEASVPGLLITETGGGDRRTLPK